MKTFKEAIKLLEDNSKIEYVDASDISGFGNQVITLMQPEYWELIEFLKNKSKEEDK